jgi:hypothetical protein
MKSKIVISYSTLILFTDPLQGTGDPLSTELSEFCTEVQQPISPFHLRRLLDGEVVVGPADM